MKFGEKIRTLREEQGFSQEELAHRTELSPLVISAFEDGSALPKAGSTYTRLAQALDTSVRYLMEDDPEDRP